MTPVVVKQPATAVVVKQNGTDTATVRSTSAALTVKDTPAPEVIVRSPGTPGVQGPPGGTGPQGPQGQAIQGPPGPQGPIGVTYTHAQDVASDTWTVVHNLNGHPSITVVNSAGDVVIPAVHYLDANTVELRFAAGFSGRAYAN